MTLLLDLSHTCHTAARTGIQRVARSLRRELAGGALAVCFDPHEDAWRPLEPWETRNLDGAHPAGSRASRWPVSAQIRGRLRRGRRPGVLAPGAASGVVVPEVFSGDVQAALGRLFEASAGPTVALFHDALCLQIPEYSPASTRRRFPSYLSALLRFDGIAAVSQASRSALLDYWAWLGAAHPPPVEAIPLGIDPPLGMRETHYTGPPVVLSVGSIEGRKNHLALLDACEALWAEGARFELRLIGMANRETGAAALRRISALASSGRPLRYDGPADEKELEGAYAACSFTVYPSLAEGFGLPVAESLSRGRPCLCRFSGALGEVASGGGCLDLGSGSAAEIKAALGGVLGAPYALARLGASARARHFRTWTQYAADLGSWMSGLRRRG
ncbi:MAG TPA: glycosyltransferase [Opitutaceae bacterium]|jgi:glycosyltransferase involved in cell wall biosynthesis